MSFLQRHSLIQQLEYFMPKWVLSDKKAKRDFAIILRTAEKLKRLFNFLAWHREEISGEPIADDDKESNERHRLIVMHGLRVGHQRKVLSNVAL